MGQIICQHDRIFNVYSTISDQFIFKHGISEEQVRQWMTNEHGQRQAMNIDSMIERAKEKGTSSRIEDSFESTILCNRCGPNEEQLSTEKIIKTYFQPESPL